MKNQITSHPWEVVDKFERVVAEYAGAPYGIAVDSCTNALFLSLVLWRMKYGRQTIMLPKKTYVGVAHAVINAGHNIEFIDLYWRGTYFLGGTNILDSARRFTNNMYFYNIGQICLSFHWGKHLPIGRGGMILLSNEEDRELLKKMRFDGRTAGVPAKEDIFDVLGYHCIMHPDDAARGLTLMHFMPEHNEDLPNDDYADLSKHRYFINRNEE